jgi:drug/metabolite transporter (DMT)-like permease
VVLVGWSPLGLDGTTVLAVLAGLGAPASYAVAGNYARAKLADVGPTEIATGMLVAGSLVLLPVAVLSGPPTAPALDGVVSIFAVGIISTAVAWPIFFRVLRQTTATAASTVTFIVPAFAIAWGALVLAEPIGPNLIAGSALILVSLLLVSGIGVRIPTLLARRAFGAARA